MLIWGGGDSMMTRSKLRYIGNSKFTFWKKMRMAGKVGGRVRVGEKGF